MLKTMLFSLLVTVGFSVAHAQLIPNPTPYPGPIAGPVNPPQVAYGNYFGWGQGIDGTGYCYLFFPNGMIANYGMPVNNGYCESIQRSFFSVGRGLNGFPYCYQFTPYGVVMNQGRFVPPAYCGF